MKTFRFIGMALMAVLMSFSFASCGDDDDDDVGGSDSTEGVITFGTSGNMKYYDTGSYVSDVSSTSQKRFTLNLHSPTVDSELNAEAMLCVDFPSTSFQANKDITDEITNVTLDILSDYWDVEGDELVIKGGSVTITSVTSTQATIKFSDFRVVFDEITWPISGTVTCNIR